MSNYSHDPTRRHFLKITAGILATSAALPMLIKHADAAEAKIHASSSSKDKTLIAYFSRTGTTRSVAERIQTRLGAELFEIQPVNAYPANYRATTVQAKIEQQTGARPALVRWLDSLDSYDRVFIGYPNWWGTMPMAVFTFLEHYTWQGKVLIPFCTHEGSAFGNSVTDLASTCSGSRLLKGLALHGGGPDEVKTTSAQRQIDIWLESLQALVATKS